MNSMKVPAIIFLIFILLLQICGCSSNQTPVSSAISTSDYKTSSSSTLTQTGSPSSGIINPTNNSASSYDIMSFSVNLSKLPKAREVTELKCIASMNSWTEDWNPHGGTAKAKVWIEFYWTNINGSYQEAIHSVQIPLEDVLVGGNTTWEGDFIEKGRIELRSQIKLPMEGVWRIKAFFSSPNFLGSREEFIYFAIVDGNAIDLRTYDYKSGTYAYLGNLGYGTAGYGISNKPVDIVLDISKAPQLGEEATITCRYTSKVDISEYSANFMFIHVTPEAQKLVSEDKLLIDGKLTWSGDLKAGTPIILSATIRFPEAGYWAIWATGNSKSNELNHKGGQSAYIDLSISADRSSFGWPKSIYK